MGGVDKADMLMSLYRVSWRTRKWYHHIFYHTLNMCVINAWLVYKRDCEFHKITFMKLLDFQAQIARSLMGEVVTRKRGRPSTSAASLSLKKVPKLDHHLPVFMDKQQRCQNCAAKKVRSNTRIKCSNCDAYLCLVTQRNCFFDFHS